MSEKLKNGGVSEGEWPTGLKETLEKYKGPKTLKEAVDKVVAYRRKKREELRGEKK